LRGPRCEWRYFVDGAFWHGHPSRHRPGRSGRYWDEKIASDVDRDRRVDVELAQAGWDVLRVWDFEVRKQPEEVTERIVNVLRSKLAAKEHADAQWQKTLAAGPLGRTT
jgi:G:T-mismatch repair DNA endonuclease (very short patch repair protein)